MDLIYYFLANGFLLPLDFSHLSTADDGSYCWSSSVEMRIRSERLEDVRLLRTSDFLLFWALKALSQLAELIGRTRRNKMKNVLHLISVGLLQHQRLVQVQVWLSMKIIRHSPFQASPFPCDFFNLTSRLNKLLSEPTFSSLLPCNSSRCFLSSGHLSWLNIANADITACAFWSLLTPSRLSNLAWRCFSQAEHACFICCLRLSFRLSLSPLKSMPWKVVVWAPGVCFSRH